MYNHYALPLLGETVQTCTAVGRMKDGIFERYNPKNKKWVEDVELFQIFSGEIDFEFIDKKQADNIIKRMES